MKWRETDDLAIFTSCWLSRSPLGILWDLCQLEQPIQPHCPVEKEGSDRVTLSLWRPRPLIYNLVTASCLAPSSFPHHDQQRPWPASMPPSVCVPCPPPPVPMPGRQPAAIVGDNLWAHWHWLASAFLPWSAVQRDWKGSLFLLMAELPGSPVRVNGLPIYLWQTPCSPRHWLRRLRFVATTKLTYTMSK